MRSGWVVCLALVAGGCAFGQASSATQPPATAGSAPVVTVAKDFSDPVRVDETSPSTAPGASVVASPIEAALGAITDPEDLAKEYERVRGLFAEATTVCVRKKGFNGWVEVPGDGPTAAQLAAADRSRATDLSRFGYGAALSLRGTLETIIAPVSGVRDPMDVYIAELPEESKQPFILARAECRSELRGDYPDPVSIPAAIVGEIAEVRSAALSSDEAVEITDQWAACMREQGVGVNNRTEAEDLVWGKRVEAEQFLLSLLQAQKTPTKADLARFEELIAPLEDLEKEIVGADVFCAQETNEGNRRREILWAAEEEWLDRNHDRVVLLLAE